MATTTGKKRPKLEPLDIKCTASNCDQGLHCFRATKKMKAQNERGACRTCGAKLVDWERVQKKDLSDASHTIRMLEKEMIRHHFWHVEIDEKAVKHARKKGRAGLRTAAEHRIRKYVSEKNAFDGRQTPKSGNVIFYAQHATASCCRKCLEEWYAIPKDRPLTEEEITYLTDLCMLYINQRLPQLTENGEKIPRTRKDSGGAGAPQKG